MQQLNCYIRVCFSVPVPVSSSNSVSHAFQCVKRQVGGGPTYTPQTLNSCVLHMQPISSFSSGTPISI
jgi:hypothetical protein